MTWEDWSWRCDEWTNRETTLGWTRGVVGEPGLSWDWSRCPTDQRGWRWTRSIPGLLEQVSRLKNSLGTTPDWPEDVRNLGVQSAVTVGVCLSVSFTCSFLVLGFSRVLRLYSVSSRTVLWQFSVSGVFYYWDEVLCIETTWNLSTLGIDWVVTRELPTGTR